MKQQYIHSALSIVFALMAFSIGVKAQDNVLGGFQRAFLRHKVAGVGIDLEQRMGQQPTQPFRRGHIQQRVLIAPQQQRRAGNRRQRVFHRGEALA